MVLVKEVSRSRKEDMSSFNLSSAATACAYRYNRVRRICWAKRSVAVGVVGSEEFVDTVGISGLGDV